MAELILPSKEHLAWAECEIGVIIHQDMQVYQPGWEHWDSKRQVYLDDYPPASCFDPASLDVDQWVEAAVNMGAKYAVLVAKHCSGFTLWPTKAHEYNISNSPWRGGKGDIVKEFIRSCEKHNIKPGLYASCGNNVFLKVHGGKLADGYSKEKWQAYCRLLTLQLKELWSNYGELFEVWFDGGLPAFDDGGREILEMLQKLQPHCIAYQGNPDYNPCIRWSGNEDGFALYPCRATVNEVSDQGNSAEFQFSEHFFGDPNGKYWAPCECDTPNRDKYIHSYGGWFWQPGEDYSVLSAQEMLNRYYNTVGHNGNFLVGMPIDNRGLVPDADFRQFQELGRLIRDQTKNLRGRTSGEGISFEITVPDSAPVNRLCIMEDIACGERILNYIVSGFDGKYWHTLAAGKSVGHKFLARIPEVRYEKYALEIRRFKEPHIPRIREFSLWYTEK